MSETPLLVARNIHKTYGRFVALAGVDMALARGERRALIGPNGAGKTTLVSVIGGQQPGGAGGTVLFDGRDISGATPQAIARLGIGRTFQISRTFRKLTVLENMLAALLGNGGGAFALSARRLRELRAPALAMLREVGLAEFAREPAEAISHGDRKRLEFGMVLATRPRLLLLDEPTAGMGLAERSALMEMMVRHIAERDITLLFVEHDIDIVFRFADVITVMARGKVFAEGTPAEIAADRAVQDIYLGARH
ncbi:MAG: ABC transporter ATP-binding protein [Burkholderiales bacterium]|nr:ABC transporter ATP-binding protein [Burkholderiales bacterium]